MATKTSTPNLRDMLAEVKGPCGPMSAFEKWMGGQPDAIVEQMHELMLDPNVGHSELAKLIAKKLGGPEFTSEKVANARKKLRSQR